MKRLFPCIIVVTLFAACEDPPPPEAAGALTSRVALAAGNVWQEKKEGRRRLITGAMLEENAALTVDSGGRALIRLASGADTFLRGGTSLSLREGSVQLKTGEIWAEIPAGERNMGRFHAGEVVVTASDAGLDIAFDGKGVTVYVARGLAVVNGPAGRAEVQSGEQVRVTGNAPLKVAPVAFWEDWTGGMADRASDGGIGGKGSGRIYGIDRARPGSPPEALQISSQSVQIHIRDGIAHTVVDQRFFNPGSKPLEGYYWFTVPEGASVERFALEVNGLLVDGEMIERKQAAASYEEAVARAFDPALLEWVDGRTFRARIFPIPATGERRVVLSYFELLSMSDGVYRYTYPMSSAGDTVIQEFSLRVHLGDQGETFDIRTLQDAKVEQDRTQISMRRSGFAPKSDFLLELAPKEPDELRPLRAMRYAAGGTAADFVMVRYSPEVDWDALKKIPGDVVVVLDTSAGGEESDRQIRADAVEAILRALSKGDRFAVMATDLSSRVVFPAKGLAEATEANVSTAVEKLAEIPSAGATDLGEMFSGALDLLHDGNQPAVVYVGDGLATVGETSSGDLATRLRRALGDSRARLFTIAVGADADVALLDRLARIGGGQRFTISRSEQTVQEALHFVGLLKTPTITDLSIDAGKGLDQAFTTQSGKLSKGDEMIMVARTHHALPKEITVRGRLGDLPFESVYSPKTETGGDFGYIPVIWAGQYLSQLMGDGLEQNRGRIISLGLDYAMMTPFTSFLVLENEQAYQQQGIPRRPRLLSSAPETDNKDAVLAAKETAFSLPLGPFGCSSQDEAPPPPPQMEQEAITHSHSERDMARHREPEAPSPSGEMDAPSVKTETTAEDISGGGLQGLDRKNEILDEGNAIGTGFPSSAPGPRRMGRSGASGGRMTKDKGAPLPMEEKKLEEKPADSSVESREKLALIADGEEAPSGDKGSSADLFRKGVCSDASGRSLEERRILWDRRLAGASHPSELHRLFFEAGEKCELPRWRDRKVMLDLIERRIATPEQVRLLLLAFAGNARIARYLRQRILRRALDPEMTADFDYPGAANWSNVSAGLAAIADPRERLNTLRAMVARYPSDPRGREMLVAFLADSGETGEAIREAEMLKRDGLASPRVMETLCDLQAGAGQEEEAKRTCSELVEFNADDPAARQRLGDIFLRHGWYGAAYRQYASLVAMRGEDPFARLRLAAAAAGMGKVDEALRIERKVATGDGEPGPGDPRRFARLLSAARLAAMLVDAREKKDDKLARALTRSLKQTQVFGTESTIAILVWEDLQAALELLPRRGEEPLPVSEIVVGEGTGLVMIDLGRVPPEDTALIVAPRTDSIRRPIPYALLTITWNGKDFTIVQTRDKCAIVRGGSNSRRSNAGIVDEDRFDPASEG